MKSIHSSGLSLATLEKLCGVFEQHKAIESVLLFGSRAMGNHRQGSDIDLTIKGQRSHLRSSYS